MFSSVISLGLFLLPLVRAEVHNVVVGGSDGTLMLNPEAIVCTSLSRRLSLFPSSPPLLATKSSSFSNRETTVQCALHLTTLVVRRTVVSTPNSSPSMRELRTTYTITVNDTNPVWVYCAQAAGTANSHYGKGMVFAVNCGQDGAPNSFTNFKNTALAIGAQLVGSASTSTVSDPYATSPAASSSVAATPPASTTAAAAAVTHTVVVGANNSFTFTPSEVSVKPNDVVGFQFQAKNHTVTQSPFDARCQKLASTSGTEGFDSACS